MILHVLFSHKSKFLCHKHAGILPALLYTFLMADDIITAISPDVSNYIPSSASFLAEILDRSPRQLFIFIIWNNFFWIKVSKKDFIKFCKKKHYSRGYNQFISPGYVHTVVTLIIQLHSFSTMPTHHWLFTRQGNCSYARPRNKKSIIV